MQLAASRYVYPDVTVSCAERDWQEQEDTIQAPRLVIEVLSPSTEAYDRGKKSGVPFHRSVSIVKCDRTRK
uniref:Putative restriction endonuclease domain-containing protein n=1 Tax=Thermosporothrix sp. COM3 TaxID=2490863 RepID=A0A455SCV9_9CHLR|nr:hypothetical protein KTC_10380 [Thermosporothrix sp. COM3]